MARQDKIDGFSKLNWELLEDRSFEPANSQQYTLHRVERARVPGGWLVRAYSATMSTVETGAGEAFFLQAKGMGHGVGVGVGLTFVPDPEGSWTA